MTNSRPTAVLAPSYEHFRRWLRENYFTDYARQYRYVSDMQHACGCEFRDVIVLGYVADVRLYDFVRTRVRG